MPKPTTLELATLKSHPVFVQRYVSTCPRTAVFACRVNGVPSFDVNTLGRIAIPFDTVSVGAYIDVKVGMTLDIGTSVGGREVGSVRIRKAATSNTLYINETAAGELPIVDNLFLTVRDEYLIWPKRWRLVAVKSGSSKYVNSFTQYKDYEEAYSDQGSKPPPKVNIVSAVTAEGDYIPVKFAGFVDSGQTYRTVTLKAVPIAMAKAATITGVLWDIADGTLKPGYALTDLVIEATFPASKTWRHVRCTATDSNSKTGWMVAPIVVHDASHRPFTAMSVDRGEAAEGHEAALTLFGLEGDADETVIPRQTTTILWERARFGASAAPAVYIDQRLLWTTRETSTPKKDEPTWSLELAGAAFWLRGIGGPADMITVGNTTWSNMTSITVDRLAAHVLQNYSTFMNVCNFKPTGSADETKERAINEGSLWEQVQALAKLGAANPWCAADGGLVLRPHPSYMTDADYAALVPSLTLSEADWPLDATPAILTERTQQVGLTECGGSSWDGTTEHLFLARAPGRTPGRSPARQDETFLLPAPSGPSVWSDLIRLLELAGHHWAKLSNPRPDNSLEVLHNLDCVEPGEVIRLTFTNALTGEAFDEKFVVTRVSSVHANEFGQPMKRVTFGLEQITRGEPGEQQEIVTAPKAGSLSATRAYPGIYTPTTPPLVPPLYGAGVQSLFAINDDGYWYRCGPVLTGRGFDVHSMYGGPLFARGSLGITSPHDAAVNPFSYATSSVDGYVVNGTGIYKVAGSGGASPTITLLHTFDHTVTDIACIDTSIASSGWIMAIYFSAALGTYCAYSTDGGATWNGGGADVLISNGRNTLGTTGNLAALHMSIHTAGVAYALAFTSGSATTTTTAVLYKTTTYGASWSTVSTGTLNVDPGRALTGTLHFPWHNNSAETLVYYGQMTPATGDYNRFYKASGGTATDLTPVISTKHYGQRIRRSITSCTKNRAIMAAIIGAQDIGLDKKIIAVSTDGFSTYSVIDSDTVYRHLHIPDDPNGLYVWGTGGSIGYAADRVTIDDRRGNIPVDFPSAGEFRNIWGL